MQCPNCLQQKLPQDEHKCTWTSYKSLSLVYDFGSNRNAATDFVKGLRNIDVALPATWRHLQGAELYLCSFFNSSHGKYHSNYSNFCEFSPYTSFVDFWPVKKLAVLADGLILYVEHQWPSICFVPSPIRCLYRWTADSLSAFHVTVSPGQN